MGKPKTNFAAKSDKLVEKTIRIINSFNCVFYIENPRGYMRKMYFMLEIPRVTVWYCQYGDKAAKPTDIWSNNLRSIFNVSGWNPRPECFNGNTNCHHDKQPRGYSAKLAANAIGKGTQGKKDNYERSKIPQQLCEEIIIATEKSIKQ
jgi:hypothetical protein